MARIRIDSCFFPLASSVGSLYFNIFGVFYRGSAEWSSAVVLLLYDAFIFSGTPRSSAGDIPTVVSLQFQTKGKVYTL